MDFITDALARGEEEMRDTSSPLHYLHLPSKRSDRRETAKPALVFFSLVKHCNQPINHSLFTDIGRYAVSTESGEAVRITMHWQRDRRKIATHKFWLRPLLSSSTVYVNTRGSFVLFFTME